MLHMLGKICYRQLLRRITVLLSQEMACASLGWAVYAIQQLELTNL